MAKVEIFYNDAGSGDWVIVKVDDRMVISDHDVNRWNLAHLLEKLGHTVEARDDLDDDEINEMNSI